MTNTQDLDFSVDLLQCLLWQYNDADALQSLLTSKETWYSEAQAAFWNDWVRDVFDLRTANAFGLTVWAAILGMPLVIPSGPSIVKPNWGFGANNVGFTQGNFAAAKSATTLTPEEARLVLRLRYFQLTTRGAVTEVNAFLAEVFGPGVVHCETTGGMECGYIFSTPLSAAVELVLTTFDVLPRPAGVTATIYS
jgi:hypothetical protein